MATTSSPLTPKEFPTLNHWRIQERMRQILDESLGDRGIAAWKFAFRPKSEYELWAADVAWISWDRYEEIDDDDNLMGAPDIVIEVLSPSNTASEILEKKTICLENGACEFWIIDPRKRIIEITNAGRTTLYRSGDRAPVGSRFYEADDILRGRRRA